MAKPPNEFPFAKRLGCSAGVCSVLRANPYFLLLFSSKLRSEIPFFCRNKIATLAVAVDNVNRILVRAPSASSRLPGPPQQHQPSKQANDKILEECERAREC